MIDATQQNKTAWEHRAYEFWCRNNGTPQEKAEELLRDPAARLRHHRRWLEQVQGLRIANPCGSNGRIAVPLALLGAEGDGLRPLAGEPTLRAGAGGLRRGGAGIRAGRLLHGRRAMEWLL